jgi:hypothetical protein
MKARLHTLRKEIMLIYLSEFNLTMRALKSRVRKKESSKMELQMRQERFEV